MTKSTWLGVCAVCAAFSAQAIQTAGDLLVDIKVADLSALANGATVGCWTNNGTVGGIFTNMFPGKGPIYSANVGGAPAITFQAYDSSSVMTNTMPVPVSICGADTWSFETWVFNPSLSQTEVVFSWAGRNAFQGGVGTGACMEFRYGGDTGNAVEHYGNNVPWYTGPNPAVQPAPGVWHHVACTRDADGHELLYVDGQLRAITTPLVMRIRNDSPLTLGSARDFAQTNTSTTAWPYMFSGSLAKVRIHDGTLSASDVVANYLEERDDFSVSVTPDSIWSGSPTAALPWEDAANWGGGLPGVDSRVNIANGGTAVVSTAVGEIGRFLPFNGTLVLSNNASLTALPWQNNHVYMGNYSNNIFNLWLKEGRFVVTDYTNGNHLSFGSNRGQAYGVIGGGAALAILDSGRDLRIGQGDGSVARMTVEDGGELCTSNGTIYVGVDGLADAKLTVNGGYVGHRTLGKDLIIGQNTSYGVLEVNGGVVAPSQDIRLTGSSSATRTTGIAQFNGGLVQARRIYPEATTGTNILYLNGGTIRNRDTRNDFIYNLDWAYVQPGGAKFDILENTAVMASQPLLSDPNLGDGGLAKSGNGILVLSGANTFTGNVTVTAGHLCFSNAAGLVSGYAGTISMGVGASVGYATAGGIAALLSRMDTSSAGGITVYPVNAAESVDLSSFPNLSLGFSSGFAYTGTYTPYNRQYLFAPVGTANTYAALIDNGSGTASVTCNGALAGALELTGDNSFTGGTVINSGMLSMGHANALGTSGMIVIKNGAMLKLNAAGITAGILSRIDTASEGYIILGTPCASLSLNLSGLPGVKVGTDQTTLNYGGVITPYGDAYLTGGGRVPYASSYYGLVLTNLTDNGLTPRTLVVDGVGMVRPAPGNTYSGGTIVTNDGALHVREDSALGAVPASVDPDNIYVNRGVFRPGSATFTLNAKRGLTVGPDGMILHPNGSQTMTMLGDLNGTGAITNTDSGTVWFGGTNNTWSGTAMINSGIVGLGYGSTFSWNPAAKLGGNGGTVGVFYNGDLTWSTQIGAALGDGCWPNVSLRKYGAGTLTVDVPQTYWGTTTIDVGVLKAGRADAIPSGYGRGNVTINNQNYNPIGRVDVNGYELNINGLSGSGCITDSTATATQILVNNNNQNTTYFGPVVPGLAVVKVGSGALNLVKGARLNDLNVRSGIVTNTPGARVAGALTLSANATLMIGGNTNEVNGLLGEYYDFSNTALRPYAAVATLASLSKLNEVLEPYAPATIAMSSVVSNLFSFGSGGALFQNKGDYRVGRWTGKFLAESDGVYNFDSASDDGSMVFVDGVTVVSNNFSQPYGRNVARKLAPVSLKAGWHDIVVAYYNGTSSYGLTVFMTPPGGVEAELPQRLLRPPAAQVGSLTGPATANTSFHSPNAAVKFSPAGDAVYDGLFTGTNGLMAIEKVGAGSQTLKRLAFQGSADVREGALALQGSGMFGGAVQTISGALSISNGAALRVCAYAPGWPNLGLSGSYYNVPNFNGWFNTLQTITNTYNLRTPDLVMGTYQAGVYFDYDPPTLYPAPYNSGTFLDFQALYQGKLVIREAGTYGFFLNSDDRSDLYIDSIQVITNVGSSTAKSGVAYLTAGTHDMFVPMQQTGGGYRLYMNWTMPGGTSVLLPNSALRPCVAQVGSLTAEGGAAVSLADKGSYLRLNQTSATLFAGAVDGPNGAEVEKTGAARLTLSGNNDAFLGSWFVSQGELWAGDGATGGTLGGSNAYVSGGAALVFNRSDDITYAGVLAGKGVIRSEGTGRVTLTGEASAFSGTLQIGSGNNIYLADTIATNGVISNSGLFGLIGGTNYLDASRIVGPGVIELQDNATLSLGVTEMDLQKELVVSNGVLALAVTNTPSDWQFDRLTLEAGTRLEVVPSGLFGRFCDIPIGDIGTIISNAFLTLPTAEAYFASKTTTLIASTWQQGDVFDFGADTGTAGTALFPGKYRKPAGQLNQYFAAIWKGKIRITEPGTYTFGTYSDDGSMIYIDGATVVNNIGSHAVQLKTGTLSLTAGLHDFVIVYQQGTTGYGLYANITFPGETIPRRLPNAMLVADAADAPAYTLTVDTIAVTNGPGVGTVSFAGPGTLRMTDLWVDTGAKLAVTGGVACAGSTLTVKVPQEVPYGVTVVGNFTATAGLNTEGVTLAAVGTAGKLRYRNKLLYVSRNNGTMMLLR